MTRRPRQDNAALTHLTLEHALFSGLGSQAALGLASSFLLHLPLELQLHPKGCCLAEAAQASLPLSWWGLTKHFPQ